MEYLVVRATYGDEILRYFIIDNFIKVITYSQSSKISRINLLLTVKEINFILLNWDFEIIAGTEKFIEYAKTKRSYKGMI